MFSSIHSAEISGIECQKVSVEADVGDGLPNFVMVGYLSSQVREAGERVKTALKNSDIHLYPKKVTINLSPADLRKSGTVFDLPIALAILSAYGKLKLEQCEHFMIIGELGLDGSVRAVKGVLPIVRYAARSGYRYCIVPKENAHEGAIVEGISVIGVESLLQTIDFLQGAINIEETVTDLERHNMQSHSDEGEDFANIRGQGAVKRAAEVAAAGMHNLLLIGGPGSAKSMTARAIAGILPELSLAEILEISEIYSISGALSSEMPFIKKRPFRAPHHTATAVSLVGGGQIPHAGEISLAHRGILFLDELPEFRKSVLEMLRQPLEDKEVNIHRRNQNYRFPSNCMLVAAMNPCRCGYYPDEKRCTCTWSEIQSYLGKVSGPFLDRMDLNVEANRVVYEDLVAEQAEESTAVIRERITKALMIQKERYKKQGFYFNSELDIEGIKTYCVLGKGESKLMEQAYEKLQMSARGYHRTLRVARTIADLEAEERIQCHHIAEAICYRSVERKYWQ